jgi:hypothetical protein
MAISLTVILYILFSLIAFVLITLAIMILNFGDDTIIPKAPVFSASMVLIFWLIFLAVNSGIIKFVP